MSCDDLVAHLRSSGLEVQSLGEVEQPFFTRKARLIRIGTTGEAQVLSGLFARTKPIDLRQRQRRNIRGVTGLRPRCWKKE